MSSEPKSGFGDAPIHAVLDNVLARPCTLGQGRLLCIDGPAGSGKTTLAGGVLAGARAGRLTAELVHLDDLYEGWSGLGGASARVAALLEPLTRGQPGSYRRWDWPTDQWAEQHLVAPVDLLIIEGVGAGALEYAALISLLVWVEASAPLRLERGLERDGEGMRRHWEEWMVAEQSHFEVNHTRERADLVVDGGPTSADQRL
jgi:uridine kinase